jgi:hypothetical protein
MVPRQMILLARTLAQCQPDPRRNHWDVANGTRDMLQKYFGAETWQAIMRIFSEVL